MLYPFSSL
jgi:hypothetical protein